MRQVKVKKIASSISHFCEILLEENKDLRIQVAHLQDELDIYKIYKNKPNYWEERTIVLSRENEELKQKLAEMEK